MKHLGWVQRAAVLLAMAGGIVVLIQAFWISYGVFVRYVLGSPDRYVTEATALLLVPVAFAGLAYALREDAYPRVTLLTERFSPRVQRYLEFFNMLIMLGIGVFLAIASTSATMRSFQSGSASEVLAWPRFYFWFPVALSLWAFSLYAAYELFRVLWRGPGHHLQHEDKHDGVV